MRNLIRRFITGICKQNRTVIIVGGLMILFIAASLVLVLMNVVSESVNVQEQEEERISTTLALRGVYNSGTVMDRNGKILLIPDEDNKITCIQNQESYQDLMSDYDRINESNLADKNLLANLIPELYGYNDSRLFDLFPGDRIGNSVQLTIDDDIQQQCYSILTQKDFAYDGACCIVMDYTTGEVIACTGSTEAEEDCICKAFSTYNPGSLIKPIIASAALTMDPNNAGFTYTCGGEETHVFGNNTIYCHNGETHGEMTMASALQQSCNGYFIALGRSLDNDRLQSVIKSFGLDTTVTYPYCHFWDGSFQPDGISNDMRNYSYIGQESCAISPIQLCSIYSAFFNGGKTVTPKFVQSIIDPSGETTPCESTASDVLSAEVANTVLGYLQSVNSEGIGSAYNDPNLKLASKTGTAEIDSDGDGTTDKNNIFCLEGLTEGPYLCLVGYTGVEINIGSSEAGRVATEILAIMNTYRNNT